MQDQDIYVTWQLPAGWADWDDADNAIEISFATESTATADNQIDVTIYRQNDATTFAVSDAVSSPAEDWESSLESGSTINVTKTNLNTIQSPWVVGDIMIIRINMQSKDNYYVRVGDIRIIYENG